MVTAGQLRHHAAISLMHVDLTVQGVRQQLWGLPRLNAHQRQAGFVTR